MRYLDVNIAANKAGPQLCAAPTRVHALTGCDAQPTLFWENI